MNRREFIAGLGGAVAWPVVALAQQGERVRRVAILVRGDENQTTTANVATFWTAFRNEFRNELARLGWVEGRNLQIDLRSGDVGRMRPYAVELMGLNPDVIVTSSAVATNAVQQQTRTIPIVFFGVGGNLGTGNVVENIARPEGNTTGITNLYFSVAGKWLQLLKDAAPWLARAAVIFNPDFNRRIVEGGGYAAPIAAAAPLLDVQVIWTPYRTAVELEQAIAAFAAEPNGGLILLPGNLGGVRLAAQYRLPAIYPDPSFVKAGGLMSFGLNLLEMLPQLASYVDRILRGAKPSDLPVQYPTKFPLAINLKTARALGLTIPPNLLALADEVIE